MVVADAVVGDKLTLRPTLAFDAALADTHDVIAPNRELLADIVAPTTVLPFAPKDRVVCIARPSAREPKPFFNVILKTPIHLAPILQHPCRPHMLSTPTPLRSQPSLPLPPMPTPPLPHLPTTYLLRLTPPPPPPHLLNPIPTMPRMLTPPPFELLASAS